MVEQSPIITPLCELLYAEDPEMVLLSLEALEGILRAGQDHLQEGVSVEEAGGLEKIEQLQDHHDKRIFSKVPLLTPLQVMTPGVAVRQCRY